MACTAQRTASAEQAHARTMLYCPPVQPLPTTRDDAQRTPPRQSRVEIVSPALRSRVGDFRGALHAEHSPNRLVDVDDRFDHGRKVVG